MQQSSETSRFGSNLFLQFILSSFCGVLTYSISPPLNYIFAALGTILNWSVSIGVIYALFRLAGTRVESLEAYYQKVPLGWKEGGLGSLADAPIAVNLSRSNRRSNATSSAWEFEWEKILSVEYIRYAGVLLIISSVFAFLFRIEWDLWCKIAATLVASMLALAIAEIGRQRGKNSVAGSCFLISFAFAQFGLTLFYKFYLLANETGNLGSVDFWLAAKVALTLVAVVGLFRYRSQFVAVLYFIIAYFTPLSMMRVSAQIEPDSMLLFVLAVSLIALGSALSLNRYGVALLNFAVACTYSMTLLKPVSKHWRFLDSSADTSAISESVLQNSHAFVAVAILYCLHMLSGSLHMLGNQKRVLALKGESKEYEPTVVEVFELLVVQMLGMFSLVSLQANIPQLGGYYGATLLTASAISFLLFLVLRSSKIDNIYTEIMLNLALAISVIGMFINTRGSWSAIVFLLFSCVLIYVSFALGSLRTRAYAFTALLVSMLKLYFECSELFDSLSGTFMILIVGVILTVLSYKLDSIKSIIATGTDTDTGTGTESEETPA